MMLLLVLALLVSLTSALEPISTIAGITAAVGSYFLYDKPQCRFIECCDQHSVIANISGFEKNVRERVYGQHLIQDLISRALRAHFAARPPAKALVLSFHGTQGSGKNYVSKFIAEAIFKNGMQSKYFRQFNGGLDFPDSTMVDVYKLNLQDEIKARVKDCERSMFIFDDVQKMPPKLLDALKPFIDYHEQVQNVDFRKSIFIFLSNTGAGLITNRTLELWEEGRQREDIKLADFESLVRAGALNEEGGLHMSENVVSNLIDFYVPFLPLEEKHVKLCIRDEFQQWGISPVSEDAMKSILEEMTFGPPNEKIFSTSGCKRVNTRVGAYVQGLRYRL